MKKNIVMEYCPLCGSGNIQSVNNIHAVWRALPVYKCESCSFRFSVRKHDTDTDMDME